MTLFIVNIGDDDGGAFTSQIEGYSPSDMGCSACNDCSFSN
jgi:hypothetical protein